MSKKVVLSEKLTFVVSMAVILFFTMSKISGQSLNLKERISNQKSFVEVSSSVDEQIFCSNGDLKLKIIVTIKNLHEKPIVFCKECMSGSALFVGRDAESLYQNKFVQDSISFGGGIKLKLSNPQSFEKPFFTIANGESFSFPVFSSLIGSEEEPALENGSYIFVQGIETWSDVTNLGLDLENKWKNEGLHFWTKNLITEPTTIIIKQSQKQDCGD